MALTNLTDIKKQKIKKCMEFANVFVNIIIKESQGFGEMREIFDRYVTSSLKSYTRTTCRAGDSIQHKIHDKSKWHTREIWKRKSFWLIMKQRWNKEWFNLILSRKTGDSSDNCCICLVTLCLVTLAKQISISMKIYSILTRKKQTQG